MDAEFVHIKGLAGLKDRDEILAGLLSDRKASIELLRELCFPPLEEGLLPDYEVGMVSPYFASVCGFPGPGDSNPEKLFDHFLGFVPSPEFPDSLMDYLVTTYDIRRDSALDVKLEAVRESGEPAMDAVFDQNLEVFVNVLDDDRYVRIAGRLADEKYHLDVVEGVLSSSKTGELRPEMAVTFLAMKQLDCPADLFSHHQYSFAVFGITKQFLKDMVKDGSFDLAPRKDKHCSVVSLELGSVIPGMDPKGHPGLEAVILKTKFGKDIPFVVGRLSVRDMQSLVMDVAAERDRRNLSYVHIVPESVDMLANILSAHGVADAMKVSVGTFGSGGRYIAVDGVRTAVPPEGVYVVFNQNLKTGVYSNQLFDRLFDRTTSASCSPKKVPALKSSSAVRRGKGPDFS